MNKKDALRQLIRSSHLDQKTEAEMLSQVDAMSDEDMQALGTALAKQLQQDVASAQKAILAIDEALKQQP